MEAEMGKCNLLYASSALMHDVNWHAIEYGEVWYVYPGSLILASTTKCRIQVCIILNKDGTIEVCV